MSEITKAIKQICEEKGLSYDIVLSALEASLAAAYRKDYGNKQQNIEAKFDPETGALRVWDVKTVVADADVDALNAKFEEWLAKKEAAEKEGKEFTEEEPIRFNPKNEIMLAEALKLDASTAIEEVLKTELPIAGDFGRMAAQTAKQVIMQKLREAERETLFGDFKSREGEIVTGVVQRRDMRGVLIDFGKISGIIPPQEQIMGERYIPGARIKILVLAVQMGLRGPEIILSRSHADMVKSIFTREIPEIQAGVVKIMGVAREAGFRSKVAVITEDDSIDPIGACIGQRGGRIQTIIAELGGEKIDVIQFIDDTEKYISNALSPAKVKRVDLNEETKEASVFVDSDQFSLAIGRSGQNVRLASNLVGWKINVVEDGGDKSLSSEDAVDAPAGEETQTKIENIKETPNEVTTNSTELPNEIGEEQTGSDVGGGEM